MSMYRLGCSLQDVFSGPSSPFACAIELSATPHLAHNTSKEMWPLGQKLEVYSIKDSGLPISEMRQ